MLSYEENVRAILECNFAGFKDEIIDIAVNNICRLKVPQSTGKWFDQGSMSCRCSNCGCKNIKESPYCPWCGAYMRESEE